MLLLLLLLLLLLSLPIKITCNLKSSYVVIFLVSSLWCFDLQEQLCRWFCILSSLYEWLQYLTLGVLFPYLSGFQCPKVFYFCHSPAAALVGPRKIYLHIQFQITCTGASALLPQVFCVSSGIDLQLRQNTNWEHDWHFRLSPCRVCIEEIGPGDQFHFHCICPECLFLGSTYKALSFSFQLTWFQPRPPPLILHSLSFSQELAMLLLSILPIFHCFFLLYSSHQSLFSCNSSVAGFNYPFSLTSSFTISSPKSISSQWNCFILFIFNPAHLSNPNYIPMSPDTIFSTFSRLSISLSLLQSSLRSSMNNRWFDISFSFPN